MNIHPTDLGDRLGGDLERMRRALLIVQNLVAQHDVPTDIAECVELLRVELDETLEEIGDRR